MNVLHNLRSSLIIIGAVSCMFNRPACSQEANLFSLGSTPPGFFLEADGIKKMHLENYFEKSRIVLIFIPDGATKDAEVYLSRLAKSEGELKARDLEVFLVVDGDSTLRKLRFGTLISAYTTENLKSYLSGSTSAPLFILIGKDRTVKLREQRFVPENELFKTIDAMPMRQAEIKNSISIKAADGPAIVNRVRFFPAAGHENDMLGGSFVGSNTDVDSEYKTLGTIKSIPPAGEWQELILKNSQPFRFVRYLAPAGSHCRLGELEFYANDKKLTGNGSGSIASGEPPGAWENAFDGDSKKIVETKAADNQFVQMDFLGAASCRKVTMNRSPGVFMKPVEVSLSTITPGATIKYTTDGSVPDINNGTTYDRPLTFSARTCLQCAAVKDGLASSPISFGVYQIGEPDTTMNTLHVGNSLTGSTHSLPLIASTVGILDHYHSFLHGGATTKVLWEDADGPKKDAWQVALQSSSPIDHFTLQPRDFNVDQEADYDLRFLADVREKYPKMQPWLYTEWVEFERQRPTDRGKQPTSQMTKVWPALTWEESMAAMVLYVEDLQAKLSELDKEHAPPKIIPSALAMGWMHRSIDEGKVPGMPAGSFHASLFLDKVHPNDKGCFLVDLTWLSAFTGKPTTDALPLGTSLTLAQAKIMKELSWDVIKNYPASGWYEEGTKKVAAPQMQKLKSEGDVTTVALSSKTPKAWFRYTLDGSEPGRRRGYIYCGLISLQPGMVLKAMAYKSGMADSAPVELSGPSR